MTRTSKITQNSGNTRIVFFGNERIATGVTTEARHLLMLIEEGYDIVAVVAKNEPAQGRKQRQLEVQTIAEAHNIPVLFPRKLTDIQDKLAAYNAIAGILVAYGKIIPEAIINLFPKGIINIHPSLLPLHRGPTPLESVILNHESRTGVSIMSLVKEMDAGPVYAQAETSLSGLETKQELADQLTDISVEMLREVLPGILSDTIVAKPQNPEYATYDTLLTKADGPIDWSKSAAQIEREIRAYAGWPRSTTVLAQKDVIITSAIVTSVSGVAGEIVVANDKLLVHCGEQSLEIQRLQPAGKQEMTAVDFIRGYLRR